jgi:hypothetical protein
MVMDVPTGGCSRCLFSSIHFGKLTAGGSILIDTSSDSTCSCRGDSIWGSDTMSDGLEVSFGFHGVPKLTSVRLVRSISFGLGMQSTHAPDVNLCSVLRRWFARSWMLVSQGESFESLEQVIVD